jgi:hypothetical protein
MTRNREFERKNREFEPGLVQSDFRMTFSEGTGVALNRFRFTGELPSGVVTHSVAHPRAMLGFLVGSPRFPAISTENKAWMPTHRRAISLALSFGCALHHLDFFRRQIIERIDQLVDFPLQRAHVSLGVTLLCREDAINQAFHRLLLFW